MRVSLFLALVFLGIVSDAAASPTVRNLVASQRPGTKLVDLSYDLEGGGFGSATVSLEVSSDGGTTYVVPVASAGGAVGVGVLPGSGRQIVWDAGIDWGGNTSAQIRFRVSADAGFAEIPGGSFTMGRIVGDGEVDAPPVAVTVSTFHLQKSETTKAQWDSVRIWALANGYADLAPGAGKAADHPVQSVTWFDAVKWCNARSEREGLTPCYFVSGAVMRTGTDSPEIDWSANGYRLPTEAEWEKAARGGSSGKRFPWGGDTISHLEANFQNSGGESYQGGSTGYHPSFLSGATPYTSPAGRFAANAHGLVDVAGNVSEWCWDWYGGSHYPSIDGALNPGGPAAGTGRVVRGGSWSTVASGTRCSMRESQSPGASTQATGFRPARGRLLDGFASIPGGSFTMGRTSGDNDADAPPITVTLSPFSLQDRETSKDEWDSVRTWGLANGYSDLAAGAGKAADHPVQTVNWFDAVKWCNARSEKEGLTPCYTVGGTPMRTGAGIPVVDWSANGYRLPTEAEWEKAARGGANGVRFPWGADGITHTLANYQSTEFYDYDTSATQDFHPLHSSGATPYTAPTGAFAPNGYGLHEMAGNVAEWCWDWYSSIYYLGSGGTTDPRGAGPSGYRVQRGGSWEGYADLCRSSSRWLSSPGGRSNTVGLRPARALSPPGTSGDVGSAVSDPISLDTRDEAMVTLTGLDQSYDGSPKPIGATTAPSGLDLAFTYDGLPDPPTAAGSYEVVATVVDTEFQGSATGTLVISKAAQAIDFPSPGNQLATATVTLSATGGGSGNPVTFSVADGPGTVVGNTLTFTGDGSVTIAASQTGDANHLAAITATRTLQVSKAPASVSLAGLQQIWDGEAKVATARTEPADLPVVFTYDDSATAPVEIGAYAVVGTIDSPIYRGTSSRVLVISAIPQSIVFDGPGDRFITESVNLAATGGNSGNAVTFAVASGPAVIGPGNVLVFTGSGDVTLVASQTGSGHHAAAAPVERTFSVVLPRPDVAVGLSNAKWIGVGVYTTPSGQTVQATSRKARTVTCRASVANRATLPDRRAADRLVIRGSRGNRFFRVAYSDSSRNLTSALLAGTHRTSPIDASDAPVLLKIDVKPNKKRLSTRKGARTVFRKKRFLSLVQASSASLPAAADGGMIRVRVR